MSVVLQNISIELRQGPSLIHDFNCDIDRGRILTITGNSGSGKSTILHFITGIIDLSAFSCSGHVVVDGTRIDTLPTEQRKTGLLAQEGLLFPHMTVTENLLYAVPRKKNKEEREILVRKALDDAQLEYSFAKAYPYTLSGGQQARLALARTMLSEPKLLLLDEPFSKLDAGLRKVIRSWVWQKIEENAVPAIVVSHDKSDIYDENFVYAI